MTLDLSMLDGQHRLLFEVGLKPVQGQRFQPTGFPDLGHAVYETPDGTCLLVDSAQSLANWLEKVCWDEGRDALIEALEGLSYVRVEREGSYLTSSVQEAHRLNSAYIEGDKSFVTQLVAEIGLAAEEKKRKVQPITRRKLAEAVFKYDCGSLVHGVFLESIDGRLRIARALTAFIEASGAQIAASGGAKVDRIQAISAEGKTAKEGFGNVIFHREEFTAKQITLYVNLDLAQIRGYGLDPECTRLLVTLALFKIRALLGSKLRLRTACDLVVVDEKVTSTNVKAFELPELSVLSAEMKHAIERCKAHFGGANGVTTVSYQA